MAFRFSDYCEKPLVSRVNRRICIRMVVPRRVTEDRGHYLVVCNEEEYQEALAEGREPEGSASLQKTCSGQQRRSRTLPEFRTVPASSGAKIRKLKGESTVEERLAIGKRSVVVGLLAVVLLPAALAAQDLDLSKRYNVLARKDAGKLQQDLNKAGQNGFRVVTGSSTGGDEVTLLIEKSGEEGAAYEYVVITAGETPRLEQRLSLASSQGYRLLPNTVTSKSRTFGSAEIVMVLEKASGQKSNYEYLLLETSFGASLQVTLAGAVEQGFQVVGMIRKKGQSIVVLEKPAG